MSDQYYLFAINDNKGRFYNILYEGDPDVFIFDTIKNNQAIISYISVSKEKWDKWLHPGKEIPEKCLDTIPKNTDKKLLKKLRG